MGIKYEAVPHKPQRNGVTERINPTLEEMTRTILAHSGLPGNLWAETVYRAASRSFAMLQIPYKRWYDEKPEDSHLKVFESVDHAHVPDEKRSKLDKKPINMRLVGFGKGTKGYRL